MSNGEIETVDELFKAMETPEFIKEVEEFVAKDTSEFVKAVLASSAAKLIHEVNKAYSEALGDGSAVTWEQMSPEAKESLIKSVQYYLDTPGITPAQIHQRWIDEKVRMGWTFSPIKDVLKKTHPSLVDYRQLPPTEQAKDCIVKAIVDNFRR